MALNNPDRWLVAEGEEDGNHLLFRVRQEMPAGVLKMQYPQLISMFWPYDAETDNGMPDPELNITHFEFENLLEAIEEARLSWLMVVITGAGRKEWHFYANDTQEWIAALNEILAETPEYPLEIEFSDDPDWSFYESLMEGVNSSDIRQDDNGRD